MQRKDSMDTFGAVSLIAFSGFLGFNQVVIKVVNEGLQPVFWAGLRSALAVFCLWGLLRLRGRRIDLRRETAPAGVLIGLAFTAEFIFLFLALDLTSVTRSSVIFYSMPVWLAIAAHFMLPGQRLTPTKCAGLLVAFAGVGWAIVNRTGPAGEVSLAGDLCALAAAISWAAITLLARGTRLAEVGAETQLFWQVLVSAPLLLLVAPFFGDFLRDPEPIHWWGLLFQAAIVVSLGFTAWLWLLSIYPPASVAAFSFLTPIFGVSLGWLLLGESLGLGLLGALAMVTLGLILINRPPRHRAA
ncbi:drug/metabolite transporter (DMT)-like permease [Aliiruegeria haliotis]|uniref:Drug/metabolite transporter (DMT)-like permease n=1 Tax=Aliiruegeria haliotis TaxID=1280846 RepID=A0A2T0RJU0_9RHOB|nr:DMT family transporter [Aliiruegeria haliotis]PRY21443.1 drug/metabolite transporter (DMT)-like permease [Aliiruegeria haliotis]